MHWAQQTSQLNNDPCHHHKPKKLKAKEDLKAQNIGFREQTGKKNVKSVLSRGNRGKLV